MVRAGLGSGDRKRDEDNDDIDEADLELIYWPVLAKSGRVGRRGPFSPC